MDKILIHDSVSNLERIEKECNKLLNILRGCPEPEFDANLLRLSIFRACEQGDALILYERYCKIFTNYIHNSVLPSLREKRDEPMLRELVSSWENYEVMVEHFSQNFQDLDQAVTHSPIRGLNEVGVSIFPDLIYKEFNVKLYDGASSQIDKERKGEQIDSTLLQNILNIFVAMGMDRIDYYELDFEAAFLEDTKSYYSQKASIWMLEYSLPDYMLKVEECLERENDRVSPYLQLGSKSKLLEKVRNELLLVPAIQLLKKEDSGFLALLYDDGKVEDLSRMCRLFSEIPEGLNLATNMLKESVENEGLALVKEAKDATSNVMDFVKELIVLHDKYIPPCDYSEQYSIPGEAFAIVAKKSVVGCSIDELLAMFCDEILKRGGTEKVNDVAFEETQEKVVKLVALSCDKELFTKFYRKKLAVRLFDNSANYEHEESMFTKLKHQFDRGFTYTMEGMVKDMTLAEETQSRFKEYLKNNPNMSPGIDLTVTVLTPGFWPSYNSININLPADMASVLLLFNSRHRLSYQEIVSQLNLSDDDAVPLLHSLSCAKYKILSKEPNTETISSTDNFVFNSNFTDESRRIKMQIPLPRVDEKKKVPENVVNKSYVIDALIVRIMKSKKILEYQQLATECVEKLRAKFEPDKPTIKQCVDSLIARSFLERDADNPELLRYLA